MRSPRRVVIDTDAGIDDAVAIALAVRSPEVHVAGVVTTYGNTDVRRATRNVTDVLERTGGRQAPPLRAGATDPLLGQRPVTLHHGESGLGHAAVRPESSRVHVPRPDALFECLAAVRGPITLVTLGPLTNLAHALEANEPLVRHTVRQHIGVFGALGAESRAADFNTNCDPEAADRVARARLPSLAVTLDATRQMRLSVDEIRRLTTSHDDLSRWLGDALRFSVESHQRRFGLSGCYVHDAIAVGAAVNRRLLSIQRDQIVTDLDGRAGRPHRRGTHSGTPMDVAFAVDARWMRHLLSRVFGVTWLNPRERVQ